MSLSTRQRLIYVWAFLTAITLVSCLFSREAGTRFQADAAITSTVILLAAIKAQFVIREFMEVSSAPAWLKRVTAGWIVVLVSILLAIYWTNR